MLLPFSLLALEPLLGLVPLIEHPQTKWHGPVMCSDYDALIYMAGQTRVLQGEVAESWRPFLWHSLPVFF